MDLYELVKSKEYQEKNKEILECFKRRVEKFLATRKFAIEHRGWPEDLADELALRYLDG